MRSRRASVIVLLFLLAGWRGLADVLQEEQILQRPPHHEVTVALKLIQIFVTDREGNPVPNLRKEDFVVTDDGRQDLVALRRVEADLPGSEPPDVIALSGSALGPGRYDCRVVVRDLENGAAAVASGWVELAEPPAEGLRVFAPLLLRPAGSLICLESPEGAAKAGGEARSPYAFDRARFCPIVGDEIPAGPARLAAVVPFLARRIMALRVDFEASIVDAASGRAFLVAMTSVNKPMVGTTESIFLDLSLAGVPPGSYEFVVSAEDRDSGLTSEGRIPLTIK